MIISLSQVASVSLYRISFVHNNHDVRSNCAMSPVWAEGERWGGGVAGPPVWSVEPAKDRLRATDLSVLQPSTYVQYTYHMELGLAVCRERAWNR